MKTSILFNKRTLESFFKTRKIEITLVTKAEFILSTQYFTTTNKGALVSFRLTFYVPRLINYQNGFYSFSVAPNANKPISNSLLMLPNYKMKIPKCFLLCCHEKISNDDVICCFCFPPPTLRGRNVTKCFEGNRKSFFFLVVSKEIFAGNVFHLETKSQMEFSASCCLSLCF